MIIRKLKPKQYECLRNDLIRKARTEPMEASCIVDMTVNGVEYAVKIQPETHCRMAVLQALKIDRENGLKYELITKGNMLSSFLEILIDQGVR